MGAAKAKVAKTTKATKTAVEDPAERLSRELDSSGERVEALQRRMSYFMLFRLGLLGVMTLVLASTSFLPEARESSLRDTLLGLLLTAGYALTVGYAWRLRPSRGPLARRALPRIASVQIAFDVLMASACVLLTGGVHSDFVFLFPVAVLGAATMGDRRRIWIAAGTCGLVFAGLSLVQLSGLLQLPGEAKPAPGPIAANVLWLSLLRTSAAIGFVAILSAYLNRQLLSSVSDLGNLRNLTENIVRSLTSGLLTVDPRRRVVFANPTARELLGVAGELPGQTCDALIPGLSAHLDDSGGFRNRFELDITRADDNREVHLGLSCSPLLDERGGFLGHVVTFQDVSKLREMERVVRRNERLAALGGLAASVAHEVRNPLAAIAGCAELLESETQNEEDQRLIRVIRRESARLNTIVSELLDYTRPRQLMRTPTDIAKLVRELVDGLRADPNLAEIEFILDLPEPEPEPSTTADIDAAQLTQVLWNLARNGAQAMDQVGKLELGVIGRSDAVSLMVRDHGRGIPSENLERIFEPFFSTKEGGSGIGLALVHRIIEDHGGDIQVFSVVGEGTSFVLTLPRKEPTLG